MHDAIFIAQIYRSRIQNLTNGIDFLPYIVRSLGEKLHV